MRFLYIHSYAVSLRFPHSSEPVLLTNQAIFPRNVTPLRDREKIRVRPAKFLAGLISGVIFPAVSTIIEIGSFESGVNGEGAIASSPPTRCGCPAGLND